MLSSDLRAFANKILGFGILTFALAILTGCGTDVITTSTTGSVAEEGSQTVPAVRINGHVHGGAYPIQGATVILMETQNTGVWTAANAAYVGRAKSLYVTRSDTRGYFSFPDTGWSCDAGQYVYIEVTGGHTTSNITTNGNVIQVGVVGDCSADLGSKAAIDGINVFLSEPSTVAAAYALHSFMSIHTGSLTGISSDGTITLGTSVPLVDITAPANNNAVPANPALNPASTATGAVPVALDSAFNSTGIYTDGTTFNTNGGFDNDGNAYSSQLLGTSLTYAGVPYVFGTANQQNVVRGAGAPVITLPSGNFNALNILAAGVNNAQTAQTFTVTYTDNTTATFTQDLSDWYADLTQNYTGESVALTTSYRDTSGGGQDNRQFSVYQYSFTLNKAKLVKSLTLPNNTNVVVLAVTATSNLPACSGVRAGTALSCTAAGLAHGFQNAYNLVDQVTFGASQTPTGVARATLPGNSQAIAPREMINTLGNILQECVDSTGGTVTPGYARYSIGTSHCGDLFYYTTPPITPYTPPTNTLQAVINIATYPSRNVTALMGLTPRNVFFYPEISQPSTNPAFAFTVSIFYRGSGLGDVFAAPTDLALDVQDNLYVVYGGRAQNGNATTLDEITSNGTGVFSSAIPSVANPASLATDNNGYIWVSDNTPTSGGVTGLYTSVNATKAAPGGSAFKSIAVTNGSAAGLAFDASSNMFVTRNVVDTYPTAVLYMAASAYATKNGYSLTYPFQRAAADSLGNFYATGLSGGTSSWLSFNFANCGTANAPALSTFTSSGSPFMVINNNVNTTTSTNALVLTPGKVNSFTSSTACPGVNSTPVSNKTNLASTAPAGAAMDGNLNVFWTDSASGLVYTVAGLGSSTDVSTAAPTSFTPCFYNGSTCALATSAGFQGMAIDSSGAMWYLSRGSSYGLVQTLGMAAPTWPLLSSENSGVLVQ